MRLVNSREERGSGGIEKGFILIYTIILVGIILLISSLGFSTALFEFQASREEAESLKAFYAADTGIECVRYYQNNFRSFDPPAGDVIDCEVGTFDTSSHTVNNQGTPDPSDDVYTYIFTLNGFEDGTRCALVTARAQPRVIVIEGDPVTVYDIQVISNGKNICSGTRGVVERTRWEDM